MRYDVDPSPFFETRELGQWITITTYYLKPDFQCNLALQQAEKLGLRVGGTGPVFNRGLTSTSESS